MNAEGQAKACSRCRKTKPLSEFGRDSGRDDGMAIYCRRCRRERYAVELGEGKVVRDGVVVRPPPRQAECQRCNKRFRPRHRRQRFCSSSCASLARIRKPHKYKYVPKRRLGVVAICVKCGTEFKPWTEKSVFCSRDCKHDASIGETKATTDGYVLFRAPRGTAGVFRNGWILEHRHVMQQHIGRTLREDETVHHINGDRADNRVENLQLRQGKHGKHAAFCCADCGSQNVVPCEV